MKKLNIIASIVLLILISACNSKTNDNKTADTAKTETSTETQLTAKIVGDPVYTITISTQESLVKWAGEGIGHGHFGTINLSSGEFSISEGVLSGGKFVIDMTSIVITDIADEKENAKLLKHLNNDDFFNVAKFGQAILEITDASDMNNVKANMTIKGNTQEIIFPVSIAEADGQTILSSNMKIDRTKFGITFNSGNFFENLGDYLIDDMISFDIKLVAGSK